MGVKFPKIPFLCKLFLLASSQHHYFALCSAVLLPTPEECEVSKRSIIHQSSIMAPSLAFSTLRTARHCWMTMLASRSFGTHRSHFSIRTSRSSNWMLQHHASSIDNKHIVVSSSARSSLFASRGGRSYSSSTSKPRRQKERNDDNSRSSATGDAAAQHRLFQEQLAELEQEREELFGSSSSEDEDVDDLKRTAEKILARESTASICETETEAIVLDNPKRGKNQDGSLRPRQQDSSTTATTSTEEDWKVEREQLYGFTKQERQAWGSAGPAHTHDASFLQEIKDARQLLMQQQQQSLAGSDDVVDAAAPQAIPTSTLDANPPPQVVVHDSLTHVAPDGQTVHMVDVGPKVATRRTATAESIVVFPDQVLDAFARQGDQELVGPKGPIFATATLAGILAAKQTSSLIPLCHPLPLEQVEVDIQWRDRNSVRVRCCCRVTHKTGVEMEALTGASVAALTIYDMVKAVSHDVQITSTQLLHKEGGKRSVDKR